MDKQYDVKKAEEKWKKEWEKQKTYRFDEKRTGRVYSIDTPPPYISGRMHIGHAFSYSQQDFIARFWRMRENVFYPFGTDDNGLPTERFIEKINKVRSKDMTRADFISLCLKTLKKATPVCIEDFKILGVSADYDIYYSTIDDHSRRISQNSFIDLYKKKLIYRTEIPTPWCVECRTSIAQAELEDKEENSLFSTLKFEVEGKELLIATTRPELLPACVAVFVHPKDKRYKKLVGKKARVPLFNYEVPVIEDESADMEKGTGVLMVCSYGDKFDVDAINRHRLPLRLILDKEGKIVEGVYKGLKVREARKKILEDLNENSLVKKESQITHTVNIHDKCGTEIEFYPTKQWFIKIINNKKKLIEQGRKIKWHPEFMRKRYENWINGLEWDWSISRNRHFGVPIPVWECKKCGKIILPEESELPVDPLQLEKKCKKCGKKAEGETMVFDTWATSSLTPQLAAELVGNKIKIPFSLRPQAHDIIRTWAFYTIVKSLYHENKIPWEDIMVSGFVTLGGEKMSKSKGHSVSPQEVFQEHGADTLRYWAAGSKLGNDLDYQEKDLVAGKKFLTKLWNASRFVFMNLEDYDGKKPKIEKIDGLFLKKLNSLVNVCTEAFESYDYSKAKAEIESFFWHTFADNYLEIVKKRIYNKEPGKQSAQYTLYNSLLTILKLMAPITPFIAEEIYNSYYAEKEKEKSIHLLRWPEFRKEEKAEEWDLFVSILAKIRQEKTKAKKAMNSEIKLTLDKEDFKKIGELIEDMKDVANATKISEGKFNVEFV